MLGLVAIRALLFALVAFHSRTPTAVDPLATAKNLARTTFGGFTYGSPEDVKAKKTDCTSFVLAVVLDLAKAQGKSLSADDCRLVTIASVSDADARILVEKEDATKLSSPTSKIRGVQSALVTLKLGVEVEPKDARPRDFIQRWYPESPEGKTKPEWFCHSGIIETVEAGKSTIYGGHKSTPQRETAIAKKERSGGIGSGPIIDLRGQANNLFVVRWTYTKPAKSVAK